MAMLLAFMRHQILLLNSLGILTQELQQGCPTFSKNDVSDSSDARTLDVHSSGTLPFNPLVWKFTIHVSGLAGSTPPPLSSLDRHWLIVCRCYFTEAGLVL